MRRDAETIVDGEVSPKRRRRDSASEAAVNGVFSHQLRTGAQTWANSSNLSLALLEKSKKFALYEEVTFENRRNYFRISARPLTKTIEDDMEMVSDVVSHEGMRNLWRTGTYHCAQCQRLMYSSKDKFRGPCVWPSFRKEASDDAMERVAAPGYNGYKCEVFELYCKGCDLFMGHAFEDGKAKGDLHPDARWRH